MRILVTGGSGFIGTHLINILDDRRDCEALLNIDICKPKISHHEPYWIKCDLLDEDHTEHVITQFQPTHVMHLAARTDTVSNLLGDYRVNTNGTEILLKVLARVPSLQRFILTSTQFVCGPERLPTGDEDFFPHTTYGRSKVLNEQALRETPYTFTWMIVRPTNIWGPWHPRYPQEFWRVLKRGLYVHPDGPPVIRSYGYVENVADQMVSMLLVDKSLVHQQVFYVGDEPVDLYNWANGFSLAITGKPVRKVPRIILSLLASIGDAFQVMGFSFPIQSSRYHSMTTNYPTPMEKTFRVIGASKYSLEEGIDRTITWLTNQGFFE